MKDPYFIMSTLIPCPKALGNDIDVYLQPLIDELKELWDNGVQTYDASMKEIFNYMSLFCGLLMIFQRTKIYQGEILKENLLVLVVTRIHGH